MKVWELNRLAWPGVYIRDYTWRHGWRLRWLKDLRVGPESHRVFPKTALVGTSLCIYLYVYTCICVYVYMCMRVYVCMCTSTYIYIYIHIHMYIHVSLVSPRTQRPRQKSELSNRLHEALKLVLVGIRCLLFGSWHKRPVEPSKQCQTVPPSRARFGPGLLKLV